MQIKEKNNVVVDDDSYHLGDFFLDYMNQPTEDHIWQIDAGTGEIESKLSVKSRSIRLAKCLRNAGLGPGDVIVVSGWNHLDVHIPFYAAFMNGHPLAGVDPLYEFEEVKQLFDTIKPKLAFCEVERLKDFDRAAKEVGLSMKLVTFHGDDDYSYDQFIKDYDDQTPEEEFKAATFDTNKIYAWLISTSGTTGRPKVAAFKHQDCLKILRLNKVLWENSITANHIKLQTSSPITLDHAIDIINKYKIVDPDTGLVISEPNKTGELWTKGPRFAIDAATGETESKLSVKSRSIRLARCLRNAGLQPGDVLMVSGRNHLDVHIPFYAGFMNGLPLAESILCINMVSFSF
ncbi:hypothetical protein MSG28_005655 [Choristoneura fumiferana]|uniref:Uncharacterized protein n=3 Tax=Choristoneura fumiferana TaxID=7141 RepID=A0ACC0L0M6_CHOFU|nr:hypothetical protein MSG28_005655 [Choristoneura fumiferana]KAI8441993.1 hypothetical protein MSG28_005655 [Choristoneura fumiferana]KAI8441994.1 hypothetical protein MSG28_005655 [Choristoneura fumiferana]